MMSKAEAAQQHADARERIADIERRTATATSPEEHMQLSRERLTAFADLKAATFVLTDEDTWPLPRPEAGGR